MIEASLSNGLESRVKSQGEGKKSRVGKSRGCMHEGKNRG